MKDQYDRPVPPDLVLLENVTERVAEAKKIEELDWYCVGNTGHIFVSDVKVTSVLGSHDFVPLSDVYPILPARSVLFIDNVLKRWSLKDGFYHA
jgi:hypothetical protein